MTIDIQKNIEEIEETINKNKMINAQMEQLDHEYDINLEHISYLKNDIEKELKKQYDGIVNVQVTKKTIKIRMSDIVEFNILEEMYNDLKIDSNNILLESIIEQGEFYIDMIINIAWGVKYGKNKNWWNNWKNYKRSY